MDGLGLFRRRVAQPRDRIRHQGQRDHGQDEYQEERAVLLRRRHGCLPYSTHDCDGKEKPRSQRALLERGVVWWPAATAHLGRGERGVLRRIWISEKRIWSPGEIGEEGGRDRFCGARCGGASHQDTERDVSVRQKG